ncbi:MAG: 30S ribosomal protein S1 [Candidatus Omnitrophica bacterium CG1_02_49_10]|nr:MAG: 30S ribosomal protein S1 [Candidatus Omnitrophica bacterium CG1_02_49_10]
MLKENDIEIGDDNDKHRADMTSLYEATLKTFKEGDIVKGKIISMTEKDATVDIGYKSEGVLPLEEFADPSSVKVGDEVDVLLEDKEDEDGRVMISKLKAERSRGWTDFIDKYKEGDLIEGKVARKVRGGLMVNVGVDAFLPTSQVAVRGFVDLNQLIGKVLSFKIIKINKPRKNVVVSRREVMQEEMQKKREDILVKIKKGDVMKGTVKNITDFGAFIDLGGVDGLLHITDTSWRRIGHPSEILSVGQEINVMILDFNTESKRISLGLKQLEKSPWDELDKKYPPGSKVKGKVVKIMPYGAFVELEKGIEGLVHISELSWTKRINNPQDVLSLGDEIEAIILNIDKDNQKISLGIKQTETNPWLEVAAKYPQDTKVKGIVKSLTDFGAFVEIENGIEGLMHVSDLSWTRRVNHPQEILEKGQEIEAVVLSTDPENRKIALGLKQLTEDPWQKIAEKYQPETVLEGEVTGITNFGVFVKLEDEIEGLIHVSEVDKSPQQRIEDVIKPGQKISVKVIRVDVEQRRIGLSMKGVN